MKNSIRVKLKKTISLLSACTLLFTSVAPLAETMLVTNAYAAEEAMEIPDEEVTEIPEAPDYEEAAVEVPDAGSEAGDPEYPDEKQPDEAESSDSSEAVDDENAESDASLTAASSGSKKGIIYWNSDTPAVFLEGATDTVRVTVSAGIGAFPEGVAMKLKPADDEKTLSRIKKTVEKDGETKVADVLAVDITFVDAEGYEIEPAAPICVTMTDLTRTEIAGEIDQHGNEIRIEAEKPAESAEAASNEASEDAEQPDADENDIEIAAEDGTSASADGTALAVHIDEKGRGELLPTPTDIHIKWNEEEIEDNTKALQEVFADSSVIFEADQFSVYAIVYMEDNTETVSEIDTDDSEDTDGSDSGLAWPENTPSVFLEGDTDDVHVTVAAGVGVLPEGVTMSVSPVTDESVLDQIRTTAEDAGDEPVAFVQAVDILFYDADGNEVKPAGSVCVTMKDLTEGSDASPEGNVAVSLDSDGNGTLPETPEEIHIEWKDDEIEENTAVLQQVFADSTVIFETEEPGVCAIVTRTVTKTLEASDGNEYRITVTYDTSSGIPANAELKASEIKADDAAYENYVEKSAEAVGDVAENVTLARAFDISLVNPETGEEYQPDGSVKVTIELLNEDISGQENLNVVHFPGAYSEEPADGEVLENSLKEGAVEFETSGFSVYVVLCTTLRQTLTASDGNEYLVTATYDNTSGIPSDAELYVSEIKEGEAGYEEYVARSAAALGEKPENLAFARPFDITLKNPRTGEEYQPNKNVAVTIELLRDDLNSYASVDVVHIPDGVGEDAQVMDSTVYGESVEFETDGFSVYVLTGTDAVPRRTYEFYIWKNDTWAPYMFTSDAGAETSKQTVRNGEMPVVPNPTSDSDGKAFAGWYESIENSDPIAFANEPYDFLKPVTENEVVELYAQFKDYLYVVFHDQYSDDFGGFPIAGIRRGVPDGEGKVTVRISDLSTTYSGGSEMAFFGWSYKPITVPGASTDDYGDPVSKIDAEEIQISIDTPLYPIYRAVKWLSFWSGPTGSGSTYYPAQKYFDGVGPSSLPVPVREGYTFQGWYAGEMDGVGNVTYGSNPLSNTDGSLINGASDGGMSVYDGHLHLTTDTTLYAKWEETAAVSYSVQIVKVDGEGTETVEKTYAETGSPGTTINLEKYKYENIDGYLYNSYEGSLTVTADAVLKIQYTPYTSASTSTLTFRDSAKAETEDPIKTVNDVAAGADLMGHVPAESPVRNGYSFKGWFLDKSCTIPAPTVMPDHSLTLYAGWNVNWYLVRIDPNYGDFHGTGATWTWKTIESDLIQEYTQVTRDYVESSSGTYYYVKHDRAYYGYFDNEYYNDEPLERDAHYTNKPGEATEYKTFEEAPGVYSYAGWFEVLQDGTEVPYDFSKHVDHHTLIRLHWKKAGEYFIKYDAGEGTMDTGGKEAIDTNVYADNAQILIMRGAVAPDGYTFAGWSVKGDTSGTVYKQTDIFTLQSDYAISISGKETVTLEAVYVKLGTASIIYDFNGGTVDSSFDYGHPEEANTNLSMDVAADGKTATVSGIVNNSGFYLSNGIGLTMANAILKGWSNKKVYSASGSEAAFYELGPKTEEETTAKKGLYGVDTEEPITLYAVWEVKATYHLNVPDGEDSSLYNWGGTWDTTKYSEEGGNYYQTLYTGNSITEPAHVPGYTGTESKTFLYWATKDGDNYTAYDFSQPVTGALDLYAFWGVTQEITVHAVVASAETLVDATNTVGWGVENIEAGTAVTPLTETSHVAAPADYAFAFAAVSSNLDAVSITNEVTAIKYDSSSRKVLVQYRGESNFRVLGDNSDIYFVYYQRKELTIGNKEMGPSGVLTDVTGMSDGSTGSTSEALLGSYVMPTTGVDYLAVANAHSHTYTNYAFAVGRVDPKDGTQMNASDLSLITTAAAAGDAVPTLRIRNTWRGFEYATTTGDDAVWTNCGYAPELYVVYYEQKPTVIMFGEETVGLNTSTVIGKSFTFNLLVTQTTTNAQKQRKDGENWVDDGALVDVTSEVFNTAVAPNTPYILTTGEANSAILFYGTPAAGTQVGEEFAEGSNTYRYVATADSVTSQTAVITQTADPKFTTSINGTVQTAEPYSYTCTSDGNGGTKNVTFTNKHKAVEVEVHVARIEDGAIALHDDLRSTTDPTTYKFSLEIDGEANILTSLPSENVYSDTDYAFGAVVYGGDNGTSVTIANMGVASIAYASASGNTYELLLKDSGGIQLDELGTYKVYYLYYPMPKIQYVKQDGTTLSLIRGSTDGINPSTTITYGGATLKMNELDVVQDQRISMPLSGLHISQASSSTTFKMPPILDDETYQRYLAYSSIGVGSGLSSGQTQDVSELGSNISNGLEMYLKISNNALSWSFDGSDWTPMDDSQAIYAIYSESGYDLQLSKVVDTSVSGPNPLFTGRQFTVTIEPTGGNSFNKSQYEIEGYSTDSVSVVDGKLTLSVVDETKVKIHGLRRGGYTVMESNNDNFDLSAKSGPIVDNATTTETVTNSSFSITLDGEKQIVLTNKPKAICEVTTGDETDGVLFYTLSDAIQYIVDNISDGTANIEMLTDYVMPAADTLTIPSNAHITLMTATTGTQKYSGSGRAVISRSAELTSASMITNSGELKLINITLDGKSVSASEPMIHSTGTLTVDRGVTLQNAISSGNGGAIYATGTVSIIGTDALNLKNNQATNGGLLYYVGTGTVTISGGSITSNKSTDNGGVVYATGGTITVSGGTLSGNSAANGGVIYTENAVTEISGTASVSGNSAANGGVIYSTSGTITVSGGSVSSNSATANGGAIYAGTGSVTVSGGSMVGNRANGNGGAIYVGSGTVTVSGGTINGSSATNGGAVYTGSSNVTVSGGSVYGNTATTDGGAIYALSGGVNISGAATALYNNIVTNGNGGAIYAGSGAVTLADAKLYTNTAANGNGGAIYVDSGSVTVNSGIIGGDNGGNRAKNGAGIFIHTGSGTFTAGFINKNIASEGGAVGVGSTSARLNFSGTANVKDNTLGEGTNAVASNVYLDRDTEAVINTSGMSNGGYVGIYVPGDKAAELFKNRGDIGAEFGICSGSATTIDQFHNDREPNLKAVVNSIAKRIYWSSGVNVRVRYLANYGSSLPNGSNGDNKYSKSNYYPAVGNAAISLLADELRGSVSNLSATSVYATALLQGDSSYDHYLTRILWEDGKWKVERRDGSKADLENKEIIIYYSEPTYLSLENNTNFDFALSALTVNLAGADRSLLNSTSTTGFGLVFAENGAIQEQLLPVSVNDEGKYVLSANGGSVNILIPGGGSRSYSLTGDFVNGSGNVQLRRTGVTAESIPADQQLVRTGTTAANSSTYEIIFGEDKAICKIWCATQADAQSTEYVAKHDYTEGTYSGTTEYTFSTMTKAVAFAKNHGVKGVTIEMLVDYLMPGGDVVQIEKADAFQSVTFTTAVSGKFQYPGTGRATISRGIGNTNPLITVAGTVGTTGLSTETTVNVHDLDFDGKNLAGNCEGGAICTTDCKVDVYNADFVNFVAYNGGAMFICFGTTTDTSGTKKYKFPAGYNDTNATLTVKNVTVENCKATVKYQRSGGGAIWTNAKVLTIGSATEPCTFTKCISDGSNMQGGAVFHRIESTDKLGGGSKTPYYDKSQTLVYRCSFNGCKAEAGGALESDATDIQLYNCTFTGCSTTKKDGGAINVYIFEQDSTMAYNSIPSKLYLEGCTFTSCSGFRNGGAVRSMAVDNQFVECTFTNTTQTGSNSGNKGGGAIYVSNNRSVTTTVTDCAFNSAVSNSGPGGAICTYSKELRVSGTTITNCQSKNSNGGGIYHAVTATSYDGQVNNVGSFASLTDCTITGCTASISGGGLYTNAFNARTVTSTEEAAYDINAVAANAEEAVKLLDGCRIENCRANNYGGGVYLDSGSMFFATVISSTIKDCTAAWSGGGLYSKASYLTIGKSENGAKSRIEGCVSNASDSSKTNGGGGIFHDRGSSLVNFADCTIDGCTAVRDGGGVCIKNAGSVTMQRAEIQNCTATNGMGGGICHDNSATLALTDTTVSGSKAGSKGGGIYVKKDLTLVRTIIENNQLTNDTVDNAAGVYMTDDGKLVVGETCESVDNSAVMNNTTQNGAASNLRLPIKNASDPQNKNCVTVHCGLGVIDRKGGYIGVTNAWNVGTQFGVSNITGDPTGLKDPDGVVKNSVFNADTSTLYGIISRTDDTRKKIVWAGPPICKITDEAGELLYFKRNGSDPAIFDILEDGSTSGRTSAFSLLRGTPTLYYAPSTEGANDGAPYTGTSFSIKMLVEMYELTNQITTVNSAGKTITLTTAGKRDSDGYPFDNFASGTRCSIIRGSGVTGSMMLATTNMKLRNVLLDGGSVILTNDGAIVQVGGTADISVELLSDAVLQYGKAANGGAVSVSNGTFSLNGGLIRFCEATAKGGAVYAANNNTEKGFRFVSGNIQQCEATSGGGVYVADGLFSMSGGSIYSCSASDSGGGVFVAGGKTFNMSGGRIGTDGANTAGEHGGGIAVGDNAILSFSKQVNISKNTCNGSTCNVELNQDSTTVINTDGLYSRSYVGVYVAGTYVPLTDEDKAAGRAHNAGDTPQYSIHGGQGDPFGSYTGSSANLYCFVNDRNGLKGGLIPETDPGFRANTIYWIKIFSVEISKKVETSENVSNEVKQAAADQEFTFVVRLWDTDENVSGIKVADIAEEIAGAQATGESSKYGDIPFEGTGNIITATITLKNGETLTAENLPDGLGYDVTEQPVEGYANIPMKETASGYEFDSTKPINFQQGKTGENKSRTDINPYVSTVTFTNILAVCKVTDASGNLLYRNSQVASDKRTPAVYKDLEEAFTVVNNGQLYRDIGNVSFSGACRIEMLVSEYTLTSGQSMAASRELTLTTASTGATDNFPYSGTGGVSTIKRGNGFAVGSMLTLNDNSDMTLTNVKLDGNKVETVATGGLVYVPSGAELTVTNGAALQNSRTTGNGAGIFLESGSHLYLSGNPTFGGTDTDAYGYLFNQVGNFKVGDLKDAADHWLKNGGQEYRVAHQDIFLAETSENPASIILTGDLAGAEGSIWVWASNANHYQMLKPFAVVDNGVTINDSTYLVFRNAQTDDLSLCGGDTYLTGQTGDNASYLYWTGGFDVYFRKIDGFGAALDGAIFTLYTDSDCNTAYQRNGSMVTAISADGTSDQNASGQTLPKGTTLFEKIPAGVYYMKETTPPTGYMNAHPDSTGTLVPNVYVLIVGEANLNTWDGTYTTIGAAAQSAKYAESESFGNYGVKDKSYAIFLMEKGAPVTTPDIAKYGIMNTSTAERKAILRKVSNTYASLEGAVFEILRYDHTLVSSTDINGATTTYFTSGASGVYFIDMLPFGTYYLHETTIPSGYQKVTAGNDGNWFILTVNENGVGYEQVTDTGTAIRNTLSPVATKPN